MSFRRISALLAIVLISGAASPGVSNQGGLCTPQETVIFQCSTGTKAVAICGGESGDGRKFATYRYGRPGQVEMDHSVNRADANGFKYAVMGYSGGGESQIFFTHDGLDYLVYDRTIRTGFSSDGHNDPQSSSGLLVLRGSKVIARHSCTQPSDAPINIRDAEKFMAKGEFVPAN